MKLAPFTRDGATRIGLVDGDEVVELAAAAPDLRRDVGIEGIGELENPVIAEPGAEAS